MSPPKYLYFMVLSSKPECASGVEETLLAYPFVGKLFITREYGQSGNHPHFNVVFSDKSAPNNIHDKFKRVFKEYIKDNGRLLRISQLKSKFDLDKTLRYCIKEVQPEYPKNHVVLKQRLISPPDEQLIKEVKEIKHKLNALVKEMKADLRANPVKKKTLQDVYELLFG